MPHNRLIGVALFIIVALLILGIIRLRRRQRQKSDKSNPILRRAREHLQAVRGAPFQAKPLANRLEKAAYQTAVDIVQKRRRNEQVLLQVSLGEILQSKDRRAYWAVNSKRVDLLVIDHELRPLAVIEIDGSGHGLSRDIARINDKIKDIVLAAAGIPLIRIPAPDDNLGTIRILVQQQLTACLKRLA